MNDFHRRSHSQPWREGFFWPFSGSQNELTNPELLQFCSFNKEVVMTENN
jgi:hypothetical protein